MSTGNNKCDHTFAREPLLAGATLPIGSSVTDVEMTTAHTTWEERMRSELLYGKGEEDHEIDAVLHIPGQLPVKGRVHDVFIDGVGVVLPKTVSLPLGSRFQLSLSVPINEKLVTLTAMVRTRSELPTSRRYGFRFLSRTEIEAQLPLGLYSIFNRRRAERFHLAQALAVAVSPLPARGSDGPAPSTRAVLANLEGASKTGCSLLMNRQNDERLAGSDRVLIRVDIVPPERVLASDADAPDTTRTASVLAIVHHRMLMDDNNVRYGCEFDYVDREGRLAVERFVGYLMERERQSRTS
jgi:hypothetical protein